MNLSCKKLINLCTNAHHTLLLVAPFIKEAALAQLIRHVPEKIALTCVTRWRPEEIIAGVSDIQILELIHGHPNGRVLLHPRLHAKYFRADNHALTGSANLTQRALGLVLPENLELLVETDPAYQELADFENNLLSSSVVVDEDLLSSIKQAVEHLHVVDYKPPLISEDFPESNALEVAGWVPLCPSPEWLYNVYAEIDTWKLVSAAEQDARHDLTVLAVPPGLSRYDFELVVSATLDQMPLFHEIDRKATSGLTDNDAIALLSAKGVLTHEPEEHWRIMKSWLTYFFPERYRLRTSSEELVRSRTIG